MYVGVHMTKKKAEAEPKDHTRNILQQFNYSILEEEKDRADRSE